MKSISRLFNILKRNKKILLMFLLTIVFMVFASLSEFLTLALVAFVIGYMISVSSPSPESNFEIFSFFEIDLTNTLHIQLIAGFFMVNFIIQILSFRAINYVTEQSGSFLSSTAFDSYLSQGTQATQKKDPERFFNITLVECQRIAVGIISPILNALSKLLLILVLLGGLFFVSYKSALLSISGIAFIFTLSFFILKARLNNLGADVSDFQELRAKQIHRIFGNIKSMLFYSKPYQESKYFNKHSSYYYRALTLIQFLTTLPRYFLELLFFISMPILLIIFNNNYLPITIETISVLAIFALSFMRIMPSAQAIFASYGAVQGNMPALQNFLSDFDEKHHRKNLVPQKSSSKSMSFQENIELQINEFRGVKDDSLILKKLHLIIEKNKTYGFIGPSGSGKTSTAEIIAGLHKSFSGTLKVDGNDLTDEKIDLWRTQVAYADQNNSIFSGSVKQNIAYDYFSQSFDDKKMKESIDNAGLREVIGNLPEKENTYLLDNGKNLSGGQKQRISIARSIYKNSLLLVLDEVTSSLDDVSESKIMDYIEQIKGKQTIILITHKKALLSAVDEIIKFKNGQIESITHKHE